jgi:hypothetical protein
VKAFLSRTRQTLPAVVYFSAPMPAVVVFLSFATYGVISIVWGFEGRRPLEVDSVFVPSPGWPPFVLPPALWIVCALFGLVAVTEMVTGRPESPLRRRSGLMAYVFAADVASSWIYSVGFLDGVSWPSPATWAAGAMALASLTATVVSVARVVDWARPDVHRSQSRAR